MFVPARCVPLERLSNLYFFYPPYVPMEHNTLKDLETELRKTMMGFVHIETGDAYYEESYIETGIGTMSG